MSEPSETLKLVALDAEDLEIISAHCQDAVLRLDDIGYVKNARRFALLINRFDWTHAIENKPSNQLRRRRAALRFECVNDAKHYNLKTYKKDHSLKLLAINFLETDAPSGIISLIFSGGCEIKLNVECIEAELMDQSAVWETKSMPTHQLDD